MRLLRGIDDDGDVLVGAGGLFGDAAHGRTADQHAARRELVDHVPPLLRTRGLSAAHAATSSGAGRRERLAAALARSSEDVRRRAHAATDQHRLPGFGERWRQFRMTRSERARRALAMNKELPPAAIDDVFFDLARVVRNII